jgi:ParB/RepB/Spo0J family partition protein
MDTIQFVPIEKIIVNQFQPPEFIDQAQVLEIAESLKLYSDNGQKGLLQVPLARRVNGVYEEAFGRHRLLAFQHLAKEDTFWSEMPLLVRELTDQEMFELMGIENFKRRDITVVEKARIFQDYMERFDATSVQTAERFGVTEETVRGTIRLNNLPDEAKEKLAKGEITVTTARSLLSMQKVAGKEAIVETLNEMNRGKDRFGFDATPEETIEHAMENLAEVKELWQSYREGKPRGGSSDAWLLDMKNFPNKLLPVLTAEDLAIALAVQDDEQVLGEISGAYSGWSGPEDWDLIYESLKGRLANRADLLEKLEHLVDPPACSRCLFYTVVNGNHYCGMEVCFNRRTYAWNAEKLRAASKDLGIEIYNKETDGEFRVLEDNYNSEGAHYKLFKNRVKDLRVALAVDIDRKRSQSGYKGVPSGSVVMVVGKTLKKLLETGQKERSEKRTKEQAAALLANARTERRETLVWALAEHVKALFENMNLAALHSLWETPGRYSNEWEINIHTVRAIQKPANDASDSEREDFYRRIFAANMVSKIESYWAGETISEHAETLFEKVKSWGVKLPKSVTKLPAEMDAEIAAVTAETADG